MIRFLVIAVSLALAACTPTDTHRASGEQLLAEPPEGWHRVFHMNSKTTRLSDFVPADETDVNWSSKLSFESFLNQELEIDSINILLSEVKQDESRCNFVQHFNLFSGLENNYETSVRLFLCGQNEFVGKGEVKLVKAIRGNEFFYLIKLIRRLEPFDVNQPDFAKEEIATWSSYLSRMKVCDKSQAEHPCP